MIRHDHSKSLAFGVLLSFAMNAALVRSQDAPPSSGGPQQQASPSQQASPNIPGQQATPPQDPTSAPRQTPPFPPDQPGQAPIPGQTPMSDAPGAIRPPLPGTVQPPRLRTEEDLKHYSELAKQDLQAFEQRQVEERKDFQESIRGRGFWERRALMKEFNAEQQRRRKVFEDAQLREKTLFEGRFTAPEAAP